LAEQRLVKSDGPDKPGMTKREELPLSLEWIAAAILVCLFGLIVPMPSFVGKQE
jgi:hypothetical protein